MAPVDHTAVHRYGSVRSPIWESTDEKDDFLYNYIYMNINFFKNNYTAVLGSESGPGPDLGSRSRVCWTWTWGLGPGSAKNGQTGPGLDHGQSNDSHHFCWEQQGEEDNKDDEENSSCSRGEALAGARDVICLEPFGTFFFSFYYANEISSLCPPLAPPQYITTQKGRQSPPAQKQLKQQFLLSFGGLETCLEPQVSFSFCYLFFFFLILMWIFN